MDEVIWYCTEDYCIFPNEEEARKGYQAYCDYTGEEYSEMVFRNCYKATTFLEFNKECTENESGYFGINN